jgi:hypothetical protein
MKKSTGVLVSELLRKMDGYWRAANEHVPASLSLYIYIYMTRLVRRRAAETARFSEMSACKLGKYQ